MVDPHYRKYGVGGMLFEAGLNRDLISLGNNPSPNAEKLMLKLGFKKIPSGRTMIFPLDVRHMLKWIIPSNYDFIVNPLGKFIQPYFSFKKNKLKKSEFNYVSCHWKDVINFITRRMNSVEYPQVLHDEDFFKWRADGLKNFFPQLNSVKTNNGSYALYSYFHPYFNIVEWHCNDFTDLKNLIGFTMNLALKDKAQTLQIVANDEKEEKWLNKLGFIKSRSMEKIISYSKNNVLDQAPKFYFTLCDTDLNL